MSSEKELCTCDRSFGWHSFVCPARFLNWGNAEGEDAAKERKVALLMLSPMGMPFEVEVDDE